MPQVWQILLTCCRHIVCRVSDLSCDVLVKRDPKNDTTVIFPAKPVTNIFYTSTILGSTISQDHTVEFPPAPGRCIDLNYVPRPVPLPCHRQPSSGVALQPRCRQGCNAPPAADSHGWVGECNAAQGQSALASRSRAVEFAIKRHPVLYVVAVVVHRR